MFDIGQVFAIAFDLIIHADRDLLEIIALSLRVSATAVVLGCLIGFPVGAAVAMQRFTGRRFAIVIINTLLGLPPVVIGLIVYISLSNAGPLGWLQLLYTPGAMIIAQTILVAPIIAALSRQIIEDLNVEYDEYLRSLGVRGMAKLGTLLFEARQSLVVVILAAFGRAIAEVGAVIIVGGNINHVTRVMTTAIALETSKGDLGLALALGTVLMLIALVVNAAAMLIKEVETRPAYA